MLIVITQTRSYRHCQNRSDPDVVYVPKTSRSDAMIRVIADGRLIE